MFTWLASLFVLFLHNNPAQVNATIQHHSTPQGTNHTLHANDDINGDVPVGTGTSNGMPG
ncbi:MAG: hypothetical protein ABSE51_08485 [Terracidiphilus sp.]|jgi:hypothetical protein